MSTYARTMPTYWTQFDWPSLATLAAGSMAVGGAIYIGRKQTRISAAQTEILHRQADTAALALRAALFDRRYRIYDDVRTFLVRVVQIADEPERETVSSFIVAMHESKLHFRPAVHDGINDIWKRAAFYFAHRGAAKANLPEAMTQEAIRRTHDEFLALTKDLEGLADLFGDELRLTDATL